MASPFNVFRRNQKIMIVVLGLLAMFAFVFIPILAEILRERQPATGSLVTSKYGDIGPAEMQSLLASRNLVNQFLEQVAGETAMAIQVSENFDPQLTQMLQQQLLRNYAMMGLLAQPTRQAVVENWLLRHKAQEMGLVVSDAEINRFISQVSEDRLPAGTIRQILSRLGISSSSLFEALRAELAAQKMRELFSVSLAAGVPPGERWDYFLRLNQQIRANVIPVPVEDFISEVVEPSEPELEEFFARYRNQFPDMASVEPGFRQPDRLEFQYFLASYEEFFNPEAITDEQIREFYEENKDTRYRYTGFDPEPLQPEEPATEPDPMAEGAPTESDEETIERAEDFLEESEQPATEEPAPEAEMEAEADAPAEESPAPEEAAAEEPATEAPAEEASSPEEPASAETPTEETPTEETPTEETPASDQASGRRQSPFRLTSLLQETDEETPAEEPAAEEAPASVPGLGAPTNAPETEPAETPATDEVEDVVVEEPAATDSADSFSPPPVHPDLRDVSVEYVLPRDILGGMNPEFEPLWKVEDRIRQELAERAVAERINEALEPLSDAMNRYARELIQWEISPGNSPENAPPRPDFEALAAQTPGITAGGTPLVSAEELMAGFEFGNSFTTDGIPVWQAAYATPQTFQAATSRDTAGNRYLYWIVQEQAGFVPELADVRDEVLHAWKLQEARQLARERAEQIAETARAAGGTLQQVFVDDPQITVEDTGTFSWLTRGMVPGGMQSRPRLGTADHIEMAGDEFMAGVYALEKGQIGVLFNNPQSIAYVVQIQDQFPSQVVLRERFLAQPMGEISPAITRDLAESFRSWIEGLENEAGLHWEIDPAEDI